MIHINCHFVALNIVSTDENAYETFRSEDKYTQISNSDCLHNKNKTYVNKICFVDN